MYDRSCKNTKRHKMNKNSPINDMTKVIQIISGKHGAPLYNLETNAQKDQFLADITRLFTLKFEGNTDIYEQIYNYFNRKFLAYMKKINKNDVIRKDTKQALFNFNARESAPDAVANLKKREGGDRHNWFLAMLSRSVNQFGNIDIKRKTLALITYGYLNDISHQVEFSNAIDHLLPLADEDPIKCKTHAIDSLESLSMVKKYIEGVADEDRKLAINCLSMVAAKTSNLRVYQYLISLNQ